MDPVTLGMIASGAAGLIGSVWSGVSARREAERNRNFQERMSSTAHQREVRDYVAAGLHPALGAMRGGGASTPGGAQAPVPDYGETLSRGVATALAVKQARAQIHLLEAQAAQANAAGQLQNVQAGDILKTQAGRLTLQEAQVAVAQADAAQRQQLLPLVLEKARAEISEISNSAERVRALTLLDNLSVAGAKNIQQFEKEIGSKGPWARLLMELIRTAAPWQAKPPTIIYRR